MQMHNHSAEIITPEACEILGVDRATLLRWVAAGKVQASRKLPGKTGAFLFNRKYIESLAEDRAKATSA